VDVDIPVPAAIQKQMDIRIMQPSRTRWEATRETVHRDNLGPTMEVMQSIT
jgi:hypothetical protein